MTLSQSPEEVGKRSGNIEIICLKKQHIVRALLQNSSLKCCPGVLKAWGFYWEDECWARPCQVPRLVTFLTVVEFWWWGSVVTSLKFLMPQPWPGLRKAESRVEEHWQGGLWVCDRGRPKSCRRPASLQHFQPRQVRVHFAGHCCCSKSLLWIRDSIELDRIESNCIELDRISCSRVVTMRPNTSGQMATFWTLQSTRALRPALLCCVCFLSAVSMALWVTTARTTSPCALP